LRGQLVPHGTGTPALDRRFRLPTPVPSARTRAERFDDLVLDAVEHLEHRWAEQLEGVEFAVEEVPALGPPAEGGADEVVLPDDVDLDELVPLSRSQAATGSGRSLVPARIVLYRRPIEARSLDELDKADLVLDVLIHEVADLLGLSPEIIDPEGHGDPDAGE
jgi:predicted Zn-dependent protease with MMP-like domain